MKVRTGFDGGALGAVEVVSDERVVAAIARDWDQERVNTQATWYYVRFEECAGPFEFRLTGLGSVYNGKPSVGGIRQEDQPFVSDDGVHWRKMEIATFDAEARTYTMRLEPAGSTLWVANLEPYVAEDLARFEKQVADHPALRREICGQSVEGRDIPLWTIGDDAAPRCAWIMARQHAWETHTSFCIEGAIRYLLDDAAAGLREQVVFKLLPMMEPDGVRAGASRFNRLGWDTNRHWDETDPSNPEHRRLRPEICAGKGAVMDWLAAGRAVDLHLNLHDTQHDIFGVPPDGDGPLLRGLYARLCAANFSGDYRLAEMGPSGVCQRALHDELGVTAALLELGTIKLPTYGRHPTAGDRLRFGADLARAIGELLG